MRVPLLPAPGLVTDETSFSVPNRCTDANNVRWYMGRPQPIGGWVKYFGDQLAGVCRNVMPWFDLSSSLNIALGTHSNLYVYINGSLVDITPSGLAAGAEDGAPGNGFGAGDYGEGDYGEGSPSSYFPRTWSLQTWGENLLASPRAGTVYIWENNTANDATEITNAPDEITAILRTPERQVLAIGCTQVDTVFNPMTIRGCKVGDYDDWTPSSTTTAFEYTLDGGGSRTVTGRMIGPYVAIWTDNGLWQGQYTGDPSNIYRFDLMGEGCGLIGPNAVQVVGQRAFWVTPDRQFYTWAPGESPSPIPCPIRGDFKDVIATGQGDKISACSIGQYGEIWWFYPHSDDGDECSRYLSMNTQVPYGQSYLWSRGILARSACVDAGATPNPIFVSPDGYVYSHENGQSADGSALEGHYTISSQTLEEGGRFVMLKGLEPDFQDQVGAVTLSMSLRKYPHSTGTTGQKIITIAPGAERKHFLLQGRSGEFTLSWSSSPAFHRPGKPVFEAEATGTQ